MQINRLFEIIYLLLDKKVVTSKELAERFEVSTRTIYRDIEVLSSAGIPVYMSKGKGGGISLLPSFVLNKTVLTDNEKEDILSSLKALNATGLSQTDTALKKLNSLFGQSSSDWIEVDFSSWSNSEEESQVFNTLKSAILSRKIVVFAYANAKGQQLKREAEPLKLCFKSGAWYLYAFCKIKNDFRFFKLKRIKELVVMEKNFNRTTPAKIFSKNNEVQMEYVTLKLMISDKAAYRVYDEFDCYNRQPDGNFIAVVSFPKSEWVYYYIATFGENCEVIEPQEIRDEVKKRLKKTLEKYI